MENSSVGYATNSSEYADFNPDVIGIFKIVFTFILIAIMFGMGCAVDHKKLLENLKRPVGLVLGLICQIVLMPVISYSLVKIFGLTPIQSLALFLVGSSPGGSNSNVITYLIRGDISLSVAMTTCSNILALGTVPLWIFIYTSIEDVNDSLKIDFLPLAITLLSIGIPVAVGILFKYKFPKQARVVPKICAGIAMVILIITIISMIFVVRIPFIFSPNTFLPSILLPVLGMVISYLVSWIPVFQLSHSAIKAISIETGIQNGGIANSVLILSFGDQQELFGNAVTIPLIYNVSQTFLIIILVAVYRIWLCNHKKSAQNDEDDLDKKDDEDSEKKDSEHVDVTEKTLLKGSEKQKLQILED